MPPFPTPHVEATIRAYDEGGYDVISHTIRVDGKTVWQDCIADDGTCPASGRDLTAEFNAAYVKYGLEPPFHQPQGPPRRL